MIKVAVTVLGAVALTTSPNWTQKSIVCKVDKPKVVAFIVEARQSHAIILYDELHGNIPKSDWELIGDPSWQRLWVNRYDKTLSLIHASTCHDLRVVKK